MQTIENEPCAMCDNEAHPNDMGHCQVVGWMCDGCLTEHLADRCPLCRAEAAADYLLSQDCDV